MTDINVSNEQFSATVFDAKFTWELPVEERIIMTVTMPADSSRQTAIHILQRARFLDHESGTWAIRNSFDLACQDVTDYAAIAQAHGAIHDVLRESIDSKDGKFDKRGHEARLVIFNHAIETLSAP